MCGGHSGLREQHRQRHREMREHGMLMVLLCVSMGKQHRTIDHTCTIFLSTQRFFFFPPEDIRKGICQHHFLKSECFQMAAVQLFTLLSCWLKVVLNISPVEGYAFLDFPLFLKLIYSTATWG